MAEGMTAKKAQFLNMSKDGLKIRAQAFKNKKAYDRKKEKKVEW